MKCPLILFAVAVAATIAPSQVRYRDVVFSQVDVQTPIQYGSAVNRYTNVRERLLLDLYTPRGDTVARRPAVVVVHGGGWISGSRSSGQFVRLCNDFAARGYVAVSIDYRLAPRNQRTLPGAAEDAQEDTKAAVRYLRRNSSSLGIDIDRIAAIGSSAGGFSVVMASYYAAEGQSGNPGFSSKIQACTDLWGGTFDLNEIDPGETPLLIVHGTLDPIVPYQQAVDLDARCRAVGIPVELHPLVGLGHAPFSEYAKFLGWSIDWYYRHLALAQKNGLRPRPGYASPGTLTLDVVGPAGARTDLYVSLLAGNVDLGPLGVLGLNPALLVPAASTTLPAQPGIATRPVSFTVPPGLTGLDVYWQAILFERAVPLTLTNTVKTAF